MAGKLGSEITEKIRKLSHFFSDGIWRIDRTSTGARKLKAYDIIKSFILAGRRVTGSELNTQAAALTYNSLLSIVPLLAVLFGIARGFGFQNIVKSELFNYFAAQEIFLTKGLHFVDNSLKYAKSGVFLVVGIIALLYTVVNLFSKIEESFNSIWMINKSRSYYRQFTDYLALFIIIPLFIVLNSTISLVLNMSSELQVIGLVVNPIIKLVPIVVTIALFVFVFSYVPNTKVKFRSALFAGVFTGICFQLFQIAYISGQVWISKYNAIYGSFAALPLFLLWVQTSWFICLFGVELSFANQNVNKFNFERQSNSISRRYKDFLIILITTLVVKRFENGDQPYTADELSIKYRIPTRLTGEVLELLQKVNLITETPSQQALVPAYIPAIDINKISIAYVINKIDLQGSEDFEVDNEYEFKPEWDAVLSVRQVVNGNFGRLLKDL